MSWPHILSLSRIVASPIVAALILWTPGDAYLVAAVIFALASLTDLIDGKLARYSQSVSPLGIFLDTTSDKVLVSLTLIGMAIARLSPAWIPLVVVGREFLISGLRSYAASCDRIISAHLWGKGKTLVTMVAIFFVLLTASARSGGVLHQVGSIGAWKSAFTLSIWLLGLGAVLTIVSGVRYIIDARPLFHAEEATGNAVEPERRHMVAGHDG